MRFQPGKSGNPHGRPLGARNKEALRREAMLSRLSEEIGPVGDAHSLLTAIYQNPVVPLDVRMNAAGLAAKFEKPALSAIAAKVEDVTFANELDAACRRAGLTIEGSCDIHPVMKSRNPRLLARRKKLAAPERTNQGRK
jgi:Family of unknown function (DUF5681)